MQATYTLANMWISAGINNLRASQARLSTNDYADQVEELFEQDHDLEVQYHTILNGQWRSLPSRSGCTTLNLTRQVGPYDGPNSRYVLLLAAANDEHVRVTSILISLPTEVMLGRMPPVTRVQSKKQALAGVMRIVPEGTLGAWYVPACHVMSDS